MNRRRETVRLIFVFSIALLLETAGGQSFRREVFETDQFSGKPVTSRKMAYGILREREWNAPRVGDPAPPFALSDQTTGESTSLKSLHRDKPVVLFFGSLGCDVFRNGAGELLEVYEKYRDRIDFVMVYIREAHSRDWEGWTAAEFRDPKSESERSRLAGICRERRKVPFRILVDSVDDKVATRWGAWPIRLFVVDSKGVVRYAGKEGPWGFRPTASFLHGDGKAGGPADAIYSAEPLEVFLDSFLKNIPNSE